MPTISMFYGVLVRMYFYDDEQHHLPHFHAEYQGMKASFAIESAELLSGSLPPNKLRLVQAWAEIHKEDLMADWNLAKEGQKLFPIAPLK